MRAGDERIWNKPIGAYKDASMARYNKVDADGKARISEDSYRILHEFPPPPTRSENSGWVVDRSSCGIG